MKGELGLAHFEGRGWPGFHHHAKLCIVAYGFLVRQRATLPPQAPGGSKDLRFPIVKDPKNKITTPDVLAV
jgi:SRSO17 transposase